MPELYPMESGTGTRNGDQAVIQVSEGVPGERVRVVVTGRSTEDDRPCTVLVIQEETGTWVIHGLGNQGIRLLAADMAELTEAILARVR